jgi:O-antigen ligase/tetratricopeptide (TPR) repeat protein
MPTWRPLGIVAIQLWIFAFVTFFGSDIVLLEPTLRITAQLVFAAPLIVWSAFGLRRRPDRLDAAIVIALGLYLVVALASRDRTGSLETLALVTVYAVVFWAARGVLSNPRHRQTVAVAVVTSLAFTLSVNGFLLIREKIAYFQVTGLFPPLEGFDVFPWETANAMPILVLLALAFLPMLESGLYRRLLSTIIVVASLVVLAFSTGRAGLLGMDVMGALVLLTSPAPRAWFTTRGTTVKWSIGAGAFALAALAAWKVAGSFIHAMQITGRLDLYPASLSMFADRPIFGSGPSTWPWARYMYGTEAARTLGVRLTHDVPLQTLADGGVVLAAAMLIVSVTWVVLALSRPLSLRRRVAFAALVGYTTAVLLDDFSFLPAVTVLLLILAASALESVSTEPTRFRGFGVGERTRWLLVVAAGACLAISVPFVVRTDLARVSASDARAAAVAGDWSRAEDRFTTAASLHPEDGGYWLGVAKARAEQGEVAQAGEAYAKARDVSPGDARAYGGLAALTSDPTAQVDLLEAAANLTAGDPQYAYRLGIARAGLGDVKGAAAAWGWAAALQSTAFAAFEFDRYGIDREAVMRATIAHTQSAPRPDVNADPAARWDVQLALDQLSNEAGQAWRAVDAARKGETGSARMLAEQARVSRAMYAYEATAAVAAFSCDVAEQKDALAIAAAIGSSGASNRSAALRIRREYLYRESTIGPMQPPGITEAPLPLPWPWSVITERPKCEK